VYAIINDRGRQATVREGDVLLLDLQGSAEPGQKITLGEVLLVGDEGSVKIGKPTVAGASVTAEVLGLEKGPKLIAFRFKRRKNVRVKRGHRQKYTQVKITKING
jgi:large subunit ribosomal protein L21